MAATVPPRVVAEPEHLGPHERLHALCDPGSVQLLRTAVVSPRMGDRARPGDGVVAALGRVHGRPVACFAQDPSLARGALGPAQADTIVRLLETADRAGAPVVCWVESAGARLQEGLGSLDGYGRIFAAHVALRGRVPQVTVVSGLSAGGGSYAPALTDFVVMTRKAAMFLTGPAVVRDVLGEELTAHELGGARVHERTGVSDLTAADDAAAARLVRELLDHLPSSSDDPPPWRPPAPPRAPLGDDAVPLDERRVYDVRTVAAGLADDGALLEVTPRWARNLVCAFARLDGRPVGVIANQPHHLGGVLDADAAQKGARFVRTCDAFGLPLVVLVDTPGFLPGSRQERGAVIRHGATLVHAFAQARVPKLTVVLRKAFGGALIAMNAKGLGADLVLAWPHARLGIMGAEQAVGVLHRRAPEAERAALVDAYAAEHLSAAAAAATGHVDEVVRPGETRERLTASLGLFTRR